MISKLIIISSLVIIILTNIILIKSYLTVLNYENFLNVTNVLLKFQIIGNWEILHNNNLKGQGTSSGNNLIKYKINDVKIYDDIKIRVTTNNSKSALIGVIKINNKSYVTNNTNFKISGQYTDDPNGLGTYSGGKYLGCYKDLDGASYGGNNGTVNCTTYCKNRNNRWSPPRGSKCINGTVNGVSDPKWCSQLAGIGGGLTSCQCKSNNENSSRTLPIYKSNVTSINDCHNTAVKEKQIYYAMQNGKECRLGSNYNTHGTLNETSCGMRCNNKNMYCGGPNANQVFSTIEPAEIQTFTDNQIGIRRNSEIPINAKWIVAKQGNLPNTWPDGKWEYIWTNVPPSKNPFCNYKKYVEYQSSGCNNPTNAYSCWNTTKSNYQVDTSKCKTIYKATPNYESDNVFKIINRAYRKVTETKATIANTIMKDDFKNYLESMENTYQAACKVLSVYPDIPEYEAVCKNNDNDNDNCKSIPYHNRISAPNVSNKNCQIGSLECKIQKDQCKNRGFCYDETNKDSPKCYLPDENKYTNLNTADFYTALSNASMIIELDSYKRRGISLDFKNKIQNLLDLARTVEFVNEK